MIERVDRERLEEQTLELVSIPSPTGDTAAAATRYAEMLGEAGMEVELLEDFAFTPTVVGRLAGGGPGPIVVLNGHLDTVPIPHAPAAVEDGSVVGRGSADMKGALVCAAEAARVVAVERPSFPGELVVVAIGLHEAPAGRGEDLTHLLRDRAFRADYAVVCELGGHDLPVAHMGQATFEIEVRREGMATHELQTPPATPHPILAAARVVDAVRARTAELAAVEHPWVGAETYVFGEVHGGDFYNRHPASCRLVGTRRWAPGNTFGAVESEFRKLLRGLERETGCTLELDLRLVRDAYEIDPEHGLVEALRGAYADVTGDELPLTGVKVVADGAIFQSVGGIPAVYHGPVGSGAHADVESMPVDELVRATRVYLRLLERLWT
jgi:acetylornithine deacetylase/succinyl-diaminopimelate desuccinylase-like protein